jgi:hypothetical protein
VSRQRAAIAGWQPIATRRLVLWFWKRLPLFLIGALLAGFALAALRTDLIRIRYGLARAMREERDLFEENRSLTARVRSLRDPARLGRIAHERGFVRPERVIELPIAPAATDPLP